MKTQLGGGDEESLFFSAVCRGEVFQVQKDGMLTVSSFPRTPSLGLRSEVEKMIKSLFTGDKKKKKKSNHPCPSWAGNAPFLLGSHTHTNSPACSPNWKGLFSRLLCRIQKSRGAFLYSFLPILQRKDFYAGDDN